MPTLWLGVGLTMEKGELHSLIIQFPASLRVCEGASLLTQWSFALLLTQTCRKNLLGAVLALGAMNNCFSDSVFVQQGCAVHTEEMLISSD